MRAVQELAEDNTAVGLLQCPHLSQPQQDQVNQLLAKCKSQDGSGCGGFWANEHCTISNSHWESLSLQRKIQISTTYLISGTYIRKLEAWRFCIDYRHLNALMHKGAYPLPLIEEALTTLNQAEWYSTLDLASGDSYSISR